MQWSYYDKSSQKTDHLDTNFINVFIKGTLSGLRQFLANEILLKTMKNQYLFHLKSSFSSQDIYTFVLTFSSCIKTALLENKVNFKTYDGTIWETNSCNTKIAEYTHREKAR